jgi:hypothetical protein
MTVAALPPDRTGTVTCPFERIVVTTNPLTYPRISASGVSHF